MITILLFLWCGVAAGYLLRRHPVRGMGRWVGVQVWVLLFLMGIEVGSNPEVVRGMARIGTEALVLTLATAATCAGGAALGWAYLRRRQQPANAPSTGTGKPLPLGLQLRDSAVIVGFFALGCVGGHYGWCAFLPTQAGFYALCLLMACVGFGIGQDHGLRHHIRHMDKMLLLLPLLTILCTWAGAAATALLWPRHGMADWLAVSSGFGYYSLSGILITELRGSELGTLALVYNIFRELVVLLGAPFLARFFGPLAPICQGGATTGDTTLPVITASCGQQFVPLSIYHGICVDFTVPFLVPFFCSWA